VNEAKTPQDFFNKVNAFLVENISFLYQLKDHWEEEQYYENFNEYKVLIVKRLKEYNLTSENITKSFTIKFRYANNYIVELKLPKSGKAKLTMIPI